MTYCPIPSERCVEIKYFNKNLFYLKSMVRAMQNRLACHLGHACHKFASAVVWSPSSIFKYDMNVCRVDQSEQLTSTENTPLRRTLKRKTILNFLDLELTNSCLLNEKYISARSQEFFGQQVT